MVDRCEIKRGGCVVIDLDGTLIKGNSLVELTKFLAGKLFNNHQYKDLTALLISILKRRLKLIPHKLMKHKITELSLNNLTTDEINEFSEILSKKINRDIITLLETEPLKDYRILIATAATDLFMEAFIKRTGFPEIDYTATAFSNNLKNYKENKGVYKLDSVKRYLEDNNLECKAVISDHEDDLPLFKAFPSEIYLVQPSPKTLKKVQSAFLQPHLI